MAGPETLVEREDALTELHAALARVRAGRGEIALVTGEAGAGKSSVIREFARRAAGQAMVMRGGCDPLSVPRPLGPLIDAAGDVDRDAGRRLVAGATRVEAFAIALSLVDGSHSDGRATVFVVEDVHWADDATLDLLTFLGRRLAGVPTLLVASYRNDEVGLHHPLRGRLGELASAIRCRVHLPALSLAAVAGLAAGSDVDPEALYRMTGGNAFYVTEILGAQVRGAQPHGASAEGSQLGVLPESVRDAVLARAARLPDAARAVLDAAAVVPGRVEDWLVEAIARDGDDDLDVRAGLETCTERGLLKRDSSDASVFRHQLARMAIVEALTAVRRRDFHARALAALRQPPIGKLDPTRLAFHAAEADDGDAVLEHAPVAATEAAGVGAHREAAHHLETALRLGHVLEPVDRAALIVRLAGELITLNDADAAVAACDQAAATYGSLGEVEGQAEAIAMTFRPLVTLGRQQEATTRLRQAAELLEGRGRSRAAAMVSTRLSGSHMLARQFEAAEREGQRAIALAEEIEDDAALAEACIQSGIALAMTGDEAGLVRIRRGMHVAARFGDDHLVALGYSQIGSGLGELRRYDVAVPALREGLEFARAREVVSTLNYIGVWLARCELELGHWDDAATIAGALERNPRCLGISRFVALLTLAWLRGRRGDPDVWPLLDEALDLAHSTGHLQRLWPVAACRAEMAWLEGRLDSEMELVEEAATLAAALTYAPAIEELAHWQRLGDGVPRGDADRARTPFGASAAAAFDIAAARWAEIGCPYEEAMARFHAGDVDNLVAAARVFDTLGAAPMRTRTAAALREAGVRVPRGPIAATRDNPHSLTDRELDVLALVAAGRTNREIGAELFISTKTVGHHVSHVLAKLEVRSRAEAAVAAERLGLTPPQV